MKNWRAQASPSYRNNELQTPKLDLDNFSDLHKEKTLLDK